MKKKIDKLMKHYVRQLNESQGLAELIESYETEFEYPEDSGIKYKFEGTYHVNWGDDDTIENVEFNDYKVFDKDGKEITPDPDLEKYLDDKMDDEFGEAAADQELDDVKFERNVARYGDPEDYDSLGRRR